MMTKKSDEKTYLARWKSEKAEQHFRRVDDELWATATDTRPTEQVVDTRFGPTQCYRWPGSGTPIVFLHGMGDTSRRWVSYAEALPDRDRYALDVMGEVGRSEQREPFTSGEDYGPWLDDALDALGIDQAHIVGMSLGGYVALQLGAQNPDRISSLILFDPVGIVKLRLARFMRWGVKNGVAAMMPRSMRTRLAKRQGMPPLADKDEAKLLVHAQRFHPPVFPPLEPLADDDLGRITAPVHVLIGGSSPAFDADPMATRVSEVFEKGVAEVLDGAGHALALTHPDRCLARLRDLPR